jgi:hypothetical protein
MQQGWISENIITMQSTELEAKTTKEVAMR